MTVQDARQGETVTATASGVRHPGRGFFCFDRLAALVLLTLAALIFSESRGWPKAVDIAGDPTVVARAIAVLMLPIAAILALRPNTVDMAEGEPAKVLLSVALLIAFGVAMPWLGLPLTGVLALLALQRLNGVAWRQALMISALVMALIWAAFVSLLHVPLPAGTIWSAILGP